MSIKDQEHYDMLAYFEKIYNYLRLDREKDKALWAKGNYLRKWGS